MTDVNCRGMTILTFQNNHTGDNVEDSHKGRPEFEYVNEKIMSTSISPMPVEIGWRRELQKRFKTYSWQDFLIDLK